MYFTIPSEPDYIRPSIVTIMVPSVIPSVNYKNIASDSSSLQLISSPSLEELVIQSIVISIRLIKATIVVQRQAEGVGKSAQDKFGAQGNYKTRRARD